MKDSILQPNPKTMKDPNYKFPVKEILPANTINGKISKHTFVIGTPDRGKNNFQTIDTSNKEEFYQFVYDDGTSWFSDPDTIQELFPVCDKNNRDDEGKVDLPLTMENTVADRNFGIKIMLRFIHVFTKPIEDLLVKKIALQLEDAHMESQDNELMNLDEKFILNDFDSEKHDNSKPYLLFIHGTNSDTIAAFSGLKRYGTYRKIYELYGKNILAYQHRTLTESPLQNAVRLVEKLPNDVVLHIISHSRGGLIGDILCKYATNNGNPLKGFLNEQIELLEKENRESDLECIKQLDELFKAKSISIEKFIRVASPSAGTLLAFNRMDHILNVFFNLIGERTSLIAALTHDLIASVLKQKDNIALLPGIEAMNPASPFIKVLNYVHEDTKINGSSLMVISGNGKVSINFHGLLVILGKLFYTQRNDLVVNTDSMYLGVNRKGKIQYFFDENATVDHIHYFENKESQGAVLNALKTKFGNPIPGYKSVEQFEIPASDRGIFGLESGEFFPAENPAVSGNKPIVILLPGIMGSNLYTTIGNKKTWLNYSAIIGGKLMQMGNGTNSKAKSIIRSSYYKLNNHLLRHYDVVVFPFDWRKPMAENASDLNAKILTLLNFDQPIKIIGHSMGGVLVRDFIAYHPETWQELNKDKNFRLLFLGSPLKGSHRILTVLFGQDSIIRKLSFIDIFHTTKDLVGLFSKLPGILSLLPFTVSPEDDYANIKTWKDMARGFDGNWPIPSQENLDDFKNYRDKINKLVNSNEIDFSKTYYIAGKDKATPCGHVLENNKLVFEYTKDGDQSVTWDLGIPEALISLNQVYYSVTSHGALANDSNLFGAIEDIISNGFTDKLSQKRPQFRGELSRFRIAEQHDFDFSENGLENAILGLTNQKDISVSQNPITVSISHGDLSYASFPVLAGHFKNDGILYAEKAIDYNVNSMLSYKHLLGVYPGEIGTCEIIEKQNYFEGTIIIGLGEPGKLTPYLLSRSIELGVTNYLLNISNSCNGTKRIGISSLLIATGYGGLSVEASMKAIIEGINNANKNSIGLNRKNYCHIDRIEFIELYESNAISGLYALKRIKDTENDLYNISIEGYSIKKLFGSKKKLPIENSEDWWSRITIKSSENLDSNMAMKNLSFSLNSGEARVDESELYTNTEIVDGFIKEISNDNRWTSTIAQTLFEMLIPNPFKDILKRKGNTIWLLDKESAVYPWELLLDKSKKSKPFCIGSGMVRQLITREGQNKMDHIVEEKALIIADPILEGYLQQLDGAAEEAESLKHIMEAKEIETISLVNTFSSKILEKLFSGSYKILHLAGHGIYDPAQPENSGMVIGNKKFLTTSLIHQMSVPELVFVNCCHLGKVNGANQNFSQHTIRFAANIGTELIDKGVKAVVVASWQINDQDAKLFATTFYAKMFEGETFGNAVRTAREKIYESSSAANNTWGAYQCYGDPFYKLVNRSGKTVNKSKEYLLEEEVLIDLSNLLNKLDVRDTNKNEIENQLEKITGDRKKVGIESPRISETEAFIYYELGMYQEALEKFDELKNNENARFTVTALEKNCNTVCYLCFEKFSEKTMDSAEAIKRLDECLEGLNNFMGLDPTAERLSLIASTYKRKAFVLQKSDKRMEATQKIELYKIAAKNYFEAYKKNKKMYPLNNYLIFKSITDLKPDCIEKLSPCEKQNYFDILDNHRQDLKSSNLNMDYWDSADYTNSALTLLFLDETEANKDENWDELISNYRETRSRYGSIGKKKAELYNIELIVDALNCLENIDESGSDTRALHLRNKIVELLVAIK